MTARPLHAHVAKHNLASIRVLELGERESSPSHLREAKALPAKPQISEFLDSLEQQLG